ncbi:hypothetical protein JOQ06_018634 [Pogonophryne albipinna]|uniref:Uncharacterized protein n=1 Tax=Pogonophryne albipinna TaxID=1090488 RepID=A0AAD6ARD8_9TELE|nr:hypothetical protein JOQ06_018634 [Pogonophryne albipinna]
MAPALSDTSPDVLVARYNTALSLSLDSLAPLRSRTVSFLRPAPWFTSDLRTMKQTGRRLERLSRRTGLTVHRMALVDHVRSYKEALSKTAYYSSLITSQQNHPRSLFSTINRLLRPLPATHTAEAPDLCSKFLNFFQAKACIPSPESIIFTLEEHS